MPKYVQILPSGVVHTIMKAQGPPEGVGVIEVQEYDVWYVESFYDGVNFLRLKIEPENEGRATVAQPINIIIRWVDIQGQTGKRVGMVKVTCGGLVEDVAIIDGVGVMPFEAAEAGEYILMADSPEGCRAVGKVIVG